MRVVYSLFPKFYKHLTPEDLAATVREVGLDTTNLVVRDGYWVTAADLATQAPAFARAMAAAGLQVRLATTGFAAKELIADSTPLAILADCGITEVRLRYFEAGENVRAARAEARDRMEALAGVCQSRGVRGFVQLHANTLTPNPSAAYALVEGLPAQWIGIEIDPGNQAHEGFEHWGRSVRLLGEYCAAMGVKDVEIFRDPQAAHEPGKGWKKRWATLDEGVTNWYEVIEALQAIGFCGTFVFMPFYNTDDPATMTAKLKREVAYLRDVVEAVTKGG